MLKFFNRLEKTRNFVILIFALLLVFSMVFFGARMYESTPADSKVSVRSTETLAEVGKEEVTVGELATILQSRGSRLPAKFMLKQLIDQRIMRVEAKRLGLVASDAEVADAIRKAPQFKSSEGGPFDQNAYEQFAINNAGSISAFEQSVRDQLSAQKLEAYLTSGVSISEEEILKDYQHKNTKFDLSYVPVSTTDLAQTIKPTDDELKNYFEQNKKNYYIGIPQKKIRYLFLNTSKMGEKLTLTDADLKAEFDKIPADKRIKGVEGQEIVLRIPRPEDEAKVMEKANSLVTQARKDAGKISTEAFAELAKGQSENPATARNGGKLSGLVKENPANPTDPYQQLLKMQPGEVTEPVNYQNRIFILRRGEAIPKTFEDAKKEIDVSLRNRRADTAAVQLAQKINDRLKEVKDVQKVAEEFATQANMNAKDMVRETGFIKPGDNIENVGVSPDFEQAITALENPGDVGDKFRIKDGFAIPTLVEKRAPRDAEFAEVKDQVAEALKLEKARSQVEEIAKQIAAGANSAADLTAAATAKGLKAQEQKSFILGSPLGQGPSAASSAALEDAIYNLKNGEVTKTPVKVNDSWYVVGVTKREEANMDDFAKQRDQLVETMMTEKRGQIFMDYLAQVRQQMESKKQIVIHDDALAKLEEPTDSEDSELPFQLPQGK
ncbi:MAG TPA: peptidylprolyl isomerase [Pyrinomonadaceae bacterium]|jgi:peptidyl-prolyl cis-trans isomerase D